MACGPRWQAVSATTGWPACWPMASWQESEVVRIDGRMCFADATAARDPAGPGPRNEFCLH